MAGLKTKGIVIIAGIHPQYGQMALNLCASLKVTCPEINVCLLHYGSGASHIRNMFHLFSHVIEIPAEMLNSNGFTSIMRSKVCLYELSPFDETILIDADVVLSPLKKISNLFEELKDVDFTIGCRSKNDLETDKVRMIWSSQTDLINKHGAKEIYNLSSEFIYFKKTKTVEKFFELAKKYFDNPEIEYVRFNGGVADELAFQIAMHKSKIKPHQVPFLPFYWEQLEKKRLEPNKIYNDYYGYSMGGNTANDIMTRVYNNLVKWYGNALGIRTFAFQNKNQYNDLRKQI